MRTYLIKYKQEDNSSVIDDRIRNSGAYFALSECEFLVTSEYETAKELYNAIVRDDFTTLSIFIVAVDATVDSGYWGVSKKDLWDWLRDKGIRKGCL